MPLYDRLVERCLKADGRSTRYRFDLDRDVCWERMSEPGRFATDSFLRDVGIRVVDRRADDMLQRGYALSVCEAFIALEEWILVFEEAEREHLGQTRSLQLLCEEEIKHVELFRRYQQHLKQSSSASFLASFEAAAAPSRDFFSRKRLEV